MIRNHKPEKKLQHHNQPVPVFYELIDPKKIFGMVGRCGGGYNTTWADWTYSGRMARVNIIREFEEGMNQICGHYEKLEKSILEHGIRDPLIISCGIPIKKKPYHIPPEVMDIIPPNRLLLEGTTGGSRLWVAQKHNIPVPCIVNDYTRKRHSGRLLRNTDEVLELFGDQPMQLSKNPRLGVTVPFDPTKSGFHMNGEWREDQIVRKRAPMWVSIMNKYGYYVDRLSQPVQEILKQEGIVQPTHLKNVFKNEDYSNLKTRGI